MSNHEEHQEHKEHEHHHLNSEDLSVKLENSASARNWIIRGVVIFLVLVFFGGMALGANDLLTRESPMPPEAELDETITNPPEGVDAIYGVLQASVADALARKPKLKLETKFDFGNEKDHGKDRYKYVNTIEFAGTDPAEITRLKSELVYLAPSLCEYLHTAILARDAETAGSTLWGAPTDASNPQDVSPARETQYGDDFSTLLWSTQVDPAQVESVNPCGFVYYRCTACGKGEDNWKEQCPECKAKGTEERPIMVKSYRDNYTFALHFADDSPVVEELFKLSTPEQAIALLGDQLKGIATVESIELACRNARIESEVNRTTKVLKSLRFKRDIDVFAELLLDPAFSPAGKVSLQFTLGENTNFSFIWPAVTLSKHEMILDRRANSQLTARIDAPLGQETPITWDSSDPDICAVDQDGYLKAGRETGEAVITVTFELDGKVYSDECAIHVKVPAENVKLNRRTLKLEAGGTKQLTAKVSPKKATYQDALIWRSENPDVATVDANGLVTAVAPGQATVYVLAEDGWFRSSCVVTVSGGGS